MFLGIYVLLMHLHTHWSWMHWSFIHSCILKFLHYHYYAIRTHIWWSKTWKAYLLHAIYYIVSHIHSFTVSFNIFLFRRQNFFSFKFVPLTRKKIIFKAQASENNKLEDSIVDRNTFEYLLQIKCFKTNHLKVFRYISYFAIYLFHTWASIEIKRKISIHGRIIMFH